jgi:hypothetical protein
MDAIFPHHISARQQHNTVTKCRPSPITPWASSSWLFASKALERCFARRRRFVVDVDRCLLCSMYEMSHRMLAREQLEY